VKHFPGHGDTDQDSHFVLPVVHRSLAELHALELPPFAHACREKVEALMTAHVLYPALDPDWPATLSPSIVTDLLRRQLKYAGVVFSDDLEMKAISENYGGPQAAALCVRAGIDVMLYGHDPGIALSALEFLLAEAARDAGVRKQVENSYHRIVDLKSRCLRTFTGVNDGTVGPRLLGMGHHRLMSEIYPGFRSRN
jgi:beta-N-acetylhexosaminidase